ncbi:MULTISPECIES: TIGR01212 family radical SAM protein [unclassified Exiguobacterium]|uniref:TIGR01212 family radical SAM protein n=1 Tax=unclassified Exiguobacterium TaxID=2644629 RepID=UPI00103DAD6D|nr:MULTISPECIES: TIGR01212 family radical SAM protein [unclassified Exiguobacterium]TCI47866.1 TIGR01212 family radical SAM protein [Exiguobacterium sp. SH5S32]TCI54750.1 TIGR01212 family radical SAM protein [Exiguobacterium sp. SH1S4]TCI74546.1 TIGR01212 family radical SAM protein [Exiguobacterium sp. SH1S1]
MNNPFGQARFHKLNEAYRREFGEKVFKVPLDGGFTCPNRDGLVSKGGCTFCSDDGSGDFAGNACDPIPVQFAEGTARLHRKWKQASYIAYFQAFSNTYAPVERLRELFEPALAEEGVVGLSIATRPDCLPDDVVDYLAELNERTSLTVELGLQTIHDSTAKKINRGHDYKTFLDGLAKLRSRNISVCVHIINGLPGETPDMMLDTAREVAKMDIQGIKIHLLHVLKQTPLARQYELGLLELMDETTYVSLVCDQLEYLPPEIVIHRLTGDGPPDLLIGPTWSRHKMAVLNAINAELKRRDSFQGKKKDEIYGINESFTVREASIK